MYQKKNKEGQQENTRKEQSPVKRQTPIKKVVNTINQGEKNQSPSGSNSNGKAWNVRGEILKAIKRYANKYAILDPDKNENADGCGSENTNGGSTSEENDVYRDENGVTQCLESDVIEGRDKEVLT